MGGLRILALDIGEKRCGIAVSDADCTMSFPLKVLPTDEVVNVSRSFRNILEDYEPSLLVSGLPVSMSGEEGPQAARIRQAAMDISGKVGIPIEFVDERLSSTEAKRIMREAGIDERHARGRIDGVAASLILEVFLEARLNGRTGRDDDRF